MKRKITVWLREFGAKPIVYEARNSSYPVSVRYEGSFVIIRDSDGNDHAYPQDIVSKVVSLR